MRKKSNKQVGMVKRSIRLKAQRKKNRLSVLVFLSFAIIFTTLIYKL